jgi:hypothetical protein
MFHFRKKTKPVPGVAVRRKRTGFVKKPVVVRESSSQAEVDVQKSRNTVFSRIYMFLWIVFFCVTAYVIVLSPFLRLDTLHIDGTVDISAQSVEQFVQSELSGKYFGIIPKNNLLFFSLARIESAIKTHFKKIRIADVARVFPHTVEVHIQERKTLLLWCSSETCFYVDEEGYAYAPVDEAQLYTRSEGFLRIIDTSAQPIGTDDPLLDREFVQFCLDIREALQQDLGIETEADSFTTSRFSDELSLKTKEGFVLHVNVRIPLQKSIQTLRLLLKKEISEERRQRLKYIDIRTENRVYYSVEGETVSAPVPAEENQSPIVLPTDAKVIEKDKKKK